MANRCQILEETIDLEQINAAGIANLFPEYEGKVSEKQEQTISFEGACYKDIKVTYVSPNSESNTAQLKVSTYSKNSWFCYEVLMFANIDFA